MELGRTLTVQVVAALAITGGVTAIVVSDHHTGKTNGCISPADISVNVGRQSLQLTNCGGVANVPLNTITVHRGDAVSVDISHVLGSAPITITSENRAIVDTTGAVIHAIARGSTLITVSGLPCEEWTNGRVCQLLRITVT